MKLYNKQNTDSETLSLSEIMGCFDRFICILGSQTRTSSFKCGNVVQRAMHMDQAAFTLGPLQCKQNHVCALINE